MPLGANTHTHTSIDKSNFKKSDTRHLVASVRLVFNNEISKFTKDVYKILTSPRHITAVMTVIAMLVKCVTREALCVYHT